MQFPCLRSSPNKPTAPPAKNRTSGTHHVSRVILLGCLVSAGAFHIDSIASSLPGMAQEFACGANGTGNLTAAFLLGQMLGHIILGPTSDVYGRKRSITTGLSIAILGALLCLFASSMHTLLAGRIIQGIGGSATTSSARAIGGDSGPGNQSTRTLSRMQVVSSCVPIILPLWGSHLSEKFGWRSVFLMILIFDVAFMIFTQFLVPKDRPSKDISRCRNFVQDVQTTLHHPPALLYTLAFGFGVATFFCYVSASSFALQNELGMSATAYSQILSGIGVFMVLAAMLTNRLTTRFSAPSLFICAVLIQFVSAVIMAVLFFFHVASIQSVVLCYALIAGSSSLLIPVGLSLAIGEARQAKGTVSALCGFVQCLCSWIITSILSSVDVNLSIGAIAGLSMSITTLAALVCCLVATHIVQTK